MSSLHRIVVGVDFGTTYTGVAWASTSNPTELEIIKNWPTAGQLVGSQAPSEISYDHEDVHAFSWGYNISPRSRKVGKIGLSTRYLQRKLIGLDQMVQA